jgi:hypothetical protein
MTDKLYAYFDDIKSANLPDLLSNNELYKLTFNNPEIVSSLEKTGFIISSVNNYQGFGIYLISVAQDAIFWSGCTVNNFKNILYHIPQHIISLARQKKILIVIDNSSEGMPLCYRKTDSFNSMHKAIKHLKLPRHMVLVINSNKKFLDEYDSWRMQNSQKELLAHCYMINGFYYFDYRMPTRPLIKDAILNLDAKDFNSLNRTIRPHRTDHLYKIINNNWHKNNLVSGSYYDHSNNTEFLFSYLLNIDKNKYQKTLAKNCPLHADGNWLIENPDISSKHIFNHEIYKNSLLSVVTETAFAEDGLFITEKTFKPIVAGHPFMILGQPFLLDELNKIGYKTNFFGINQTYDRILNPKDRFVAFHDSLKKWINTPRDVKIKLLVKSIPMIEHNRKIFSSVNYENDGYKMLMSTVRDIFHERYRC